MSFGSNGPGLPQFESAFGCLFTHYALMDHGYYNCDCSFMHHYLRLLNKLFKWMHTEYYSNIECVVFYYK